MAKLAGVPESVLERARQIATQLNENDILGHTKDIDAATVYEEPIYNYGIEQQTKSKRKCRHKTEAEKMGQLSLFGTNNSNIKTDDIILELHDLDLSNTTPIDAMNILYKMQTRLRERI